MYNDYFGLSESPFSIAPNPQFLYLSERHQEALAHLLYGINSDGGFLLLTGEVGTGKTTISRRLLEDMPDDVDTAFILNPKLSAAELLATICDDFYLSYPEKASIKTLVDIINQFLLKSHNDGRRAVLIIDEAQNLSVNVLEQLRLLTNLETNYRKLLQIILLGQPELLDLLAKPELRQLSQRVTARFHLSALTKFEAAEYIRFRLKVAGAKGILFPDKAVKQIYNFSHGIPRLINLICDRALLGTYAQNQLQVSVKTVKKSSKEIIGTGSTSARRVNPALVILAPLVLLASIYFFYQEQDKPIVIKPIKVEKETLLESRKINKAKPTNAIFPSTINGAKPMEITNNSIRYSGVQNLTGANNLTDLYAELFLLWGSPITIKNAVKPCNIAIDIGLSCYEKSGSFNDIITLNRPMIVEFDLTKNSYPIPENNIERNRKENFLITKISGQGIVLFANNQLYLVERQDFLKYWTGNFTLLWRIPPGYTQPLRQGSAGQSVRWLAHMMTKADNKPSTFDTFDTSKSTIYQADLVQRVTEFQSSRGMQANGVVGAETWIHINNMEPVGIPKIHTIIKDA